MHRLTSDADRQWLAMWSVSLFCALIACASNELFWRNRSFVPQVVDSRDLWAQHRARVSSSRPCNRNAVALLGASRIQFGLSPQHFSDEAARLGRNGLEVSMLAVNAHYPLAALRDLSYDAGFCGLVVVGIDSRGFVRDAWEMQTPYVKHYEERWTLASNLSRYLLTELQTRLVLGFQGNGLTTVLKESWIDGAPLPRGDSSVRFSSDRSAATDYTQGNIDAIRSRREAGTKHAIQDYVPPSPQQWLADAADVVLWVRAINGRGGRVVFYHEPVSGETARFDDVKFPRLEYWDRLRDHMPATMINYIDYPTLIIDTPDTSHIDARDIERHTRALVQVIASVDLL
jgi:hypothetical protein